MPASPRRESIPIAVIAEMIVSKLNCALNKPYITGTTAKTECPGKARLFQEFGIQNLYLLCSMP